MCIYIYALLSMGEGDLLGLVMSRRLQACGIETCFYLPKQPQTPPPWPSTTIPYMPSTAIHYHSHPLPASDLATTCFPFPIPHLCPTAATTSSVAAFTRAIAARMLRTIMLPMQVIIMMPRRMLVGLAVAMMTMMMGALFFSA